MHSVKERRISKSVFNDESNQHFKVSFNHLLKPVKLNSYKITRQIIMIDRLTLLHFNPS